ncbi:hypothetical protein Pmar_PMAR018363 [Perkinsus marinus ATCC 50983]|uniref:Uncharacterized protein n=1 Tax=Perkinsus marinus (strain ATCC 50983 / TXsc) TaxID=423536 RepID=C5LS08_PERM5|nr:hypothetical protein Pmar_PMAR018363 [Perkinsus marinus ATCC 50983]EER00480.1 hypothetical protein Pmar_PMAR018363 [Perkinsus marinus ATCC 50983]|eukprot:XP_002767762.1 hypothetical protein Pmar_PMAR018363 [Perkinsus marinus ATCC 50983]
MGKIRKVPARASLMKLASAIDWLQRGPQNNDTTVAIRRMCCELHWREFCQTPWTIAKKQSTIQQTLRFARFNRYRDFLDDFKHLQLVQHGRIFPVAKS